MSDKKIDRVKRDIECAAEDARKLIAEEAEKARKIVLENSNNGGLLDFVYEQGTLILAIVGVCFGVYFTFANPTQDNNIALQLQDARITSQRETINDLTKTSQNDTQEVKSAIKDLVGQVNNLNTEIATLTAIINERIPAKK